ncbi:DUF2249 domain-containing protein [Rugamonas sp. FT107W]|uniref:DUF2249 domain-containing protein n=1 Tax=Duganella vulcania TaxID=2692166 RepID=A0A845HDU3_9BURK|nr:DUF2249 domain-containing protein [Duganella vulcania]MYN16447.1 DUF2249 domain-containing protein [Duganella vulcania]
MSAALAHEGSARLLDVGGMEPPEPMVRILDALDTLGPDERLRVLIDRNPIPLYRVLQRYGFEYRTTQLEDLRFEVLIWLVPDAPSA